MANGSRGAEEQVEMRARKGGWGRLLGGGSGQPGPVAVGLAGMLLLLGTTGCGGGGDGGPAGGGGSAADSAPSADCCRLPDTGTSTPRDSEPPPSDTSREDLDSSVPEAGCPGGGCPDATADVEPISEVGSPDDAGPGDVGPPPSGCRVHGCRGRQVCQPDGSCREPDVCGADEDCFAGRVCPEEGEARAAEVPRRRCAPRCTRNEDCGEGWWCDIATGHCARPSVCSDHADCGEEETCVDGRCGERPPPGCGPGLPCGGRRVCGEYGQCEAPARCEGDADCGEGLVCRPSTGRCAACDEERPCQGGLRCDLDRAAPRCIEPPVCESGDDCLPGRACIGGRCVPEACDEDRLAPNGTPAMARAIGGGTYRRLVLCPAAEDWFLVELAPGSGLRVSAVAAGGSADPEIAIYPAAWGAPPVAEGSRNGPFEVATLPFSAAGGTFRVAVWEVVGRPASYDLDVLRAPGGLCADDPAEAAAGDDAPAVARRLDLGSVVPAGPGVAAAVADGSLCPGDPDFFVVDLPEGAPPLAVDLLLDSRQGGATLDAYLPGSEEPLAVARARPGGMALTLDPPPPAGDVLLRVAGPATPYRLAVAALSPEAAQACAHLPEVDEGGVTDLAPAGGPGPAPSCAPLPLAPTSLVMGRVTLPAPATVHVEVEEADGPPLVALLAGCGNPFAEVLCLPGPALVTGPLPAGEYTVVVASAEADAGATAARVRLTLGSVEPPPANDLCADAPLVRPAAQPVSIRGTTAFALPDGATVPCGAPATAAEVHYRLNLEAESLLEVAPQGDGGPTVLALRTACGESPLLACASAGRPLTVGRLPAGNYILSVAAGGPGGREGGPFHLVVRTADPVGYDRCEGARDGGPGGIFVGTTVGARPDYLLTRAGCTGYLAVGPDVAYRFDLRQGDRFVARLEPEWDANLYLVTDCSRVQESCVVGADEEVGPRPEEIEYLVEESGTYYLIVDGPTAEAGAFRLAAGPNPECLDDGDCAVGERCAPSLRCVRSECERDADCGGGRSCEGGRCSEPPCRTHRACADGRVCDGGVCSYLPGDGFGSGVLDLPIPDDDLLGVEDSLEVSGLRRLGPVTEVWVAVAIEHPCRADLEVSLVAPGGREVRLHNQTGGCVPGLDGLWGPGRPADGPGDLADLAGGVAEGTYVLRVRDLSPGDEGRLLGWSVHLGVAGP